MTKALHRVRMASEEAAHWYLLCSDNRKLSRGERKRLLAWLKRSPENVAEMLRMCDVDGMVAGQQLLNRLGELEQQNNVVNISEKYGLEFRGSPAGRNQKKHAPPLLALAAMLTALSLTVLLGFVALNRTPEGTVVTEASQSQRLTLEDGSSVHMDARTRIKVEFSAQFRIVHVIEGQAVFDVTKDPNRPFIARTESVDVTAVGTRFGVSVYDGITATVEEGVVRVTPKGKPHHESAVTLRAGQEFRILSGSFGAPSEAEVRKVDATRELAWANGWLIFDTGDQIGEIVAEFNRRNAMQIAIDDSGIAERELKDLYRVRVDLPESFTRLLESQEGIVVIKDGSRIALRLTSE